MGTAVEISVADRSETRSRSAMAAAFQEFERVGALLDERRPESVTALLNREASSRKVAVNEEVFSILASSLMTSDASGGAFDITVGPLTKLWGFDTGGHLPADGEIEGALRKVGYKHLMLDQDSSSVGFDINGMALDMGAVGKRWALDRVAGILRERGVSHAIIDAGGDIRVLGTRPDGTPWRIGVQHPREPGRLLATLEVTDAAVITSGDYERFFERDGVRYHHIIDPATGRPASACRSVTLVAPTAMEASATAAFVLGPERGIAYLRSLPGVHGLIVDAAGGLHWTDEAFARSVRP
jgi:thiamine biosynthesis lipoprotein